MKILNIVVKIFVIRMHGINLSKVLVLVQVSLPTVCVALWPSWHGLRAESPEESPSAPQALATVPPCVNLCSFGCKHKS